MARWLLGLLGVLLPAGFGASFPPPPHAEAAPTSAKVTLMPRASSSPAAPANPPTPRAANFERAAEPLRIAGAHSLMIAPRGCEGLSSKVDLLIHFHGAYTTVEPQLMKSGIDALFVVVNLGNGSGAYEDAFASKHSLGDYLESVRKRISQRCGADIQIGRLALSGWSAGYGAIYRSIARPDGADRVDAVLLADGMHVGFEGTTRTARAAAMEPFRGFAERAGTGEKLMAVTHSAIVPPGYASTTLTADFLVDALRLEAKPLPPSSPRVDMRYTRRAELGALFIDGYAGNDAHAHCTHLYAIGVTLWSRLQARWAAPH